MDVHARIKHWRVAKGLTRQALADAVGVTVAAVYQWEGSGKSKVRPSLEKLEEVVLALGLTMERFYGRVPKSKAAS